MEPKQKRLVLLVGQSGMAGESFCRLLRDFMPDRDVGLVPAAVEGAPVSAWLPGGTAPHAPASHPYDEAIRRARAAQESGEIVAVLWHQGEAGAKLHTPDYGEKIRRVIENFRHDLRLPETVPFVMGTPASFREEISPETKSGATAIGAAMEETAAAPYIGQIGAHAICAAMEETAATLPYVGLVNAHGLDDNGDSPHISANARHVLGERFFRMWRSMRAVSPEKLAAQALKYRGAPRFRTPVLLDPGEFLVTSPFGRRTHPVTGEEETFHAGIDGALWNGRMLLETGICAWRDGVVLEAADTDGPAGTCVAIDHGDGLVSKYFHLERGTLAVAAGARVKSGSYLGWMGKTGRATGEHLHFQIERGGTPVDPLA